jgi:hypothetical protein
MKVQEKFIALVIAIRQFLEDLNAIHLQPFLSDWPSTKSITSSILSNSLPVLSYLPAVVKAADKKTERLVKMLVSLANFLAWGQTYSAQDFGLGFLEKYGWTEIIGQRGPIASDRIACGFLLLGPRVEYPQHHHEAQEVYVPLTGKTLWLKGDQDWTYRTPGLPVYHASWEMHAMRTETVPLLALYLWRGGDLAQKSLLIP